MKTKAVFLNMVLILAVAVGSVFAQTRTITFYAYGRSIPDATPGHAFVQFDDSGTYGFYPRNGFRDRIIGAIWGNVGGVIWGRVIGAGEIRCDDDNIKRAQNNGGTFQVNEAQFQTAYNVYLRWRNNPGNYVIGHRDCINFVYEVADAIGLSHAPYRSNRSVWPMSAVESIYAALLLKGIYQVSGDSGYIRVFPNYTYNAQRHIYVPQEGSYVFEQNNNNNNAFAISVGQFRGNEIHFDVVWIASVFVVQEGYNYRVGEFRRGTRINSTTWDNHLGALWVWRRDIQ